MKLRDGYAAVITRAFPALRIRRVELLAGGQYNAVLLVNGELLFRFAKVPAAVATIAREVTVLPLIQKHLPLPVPDPIYTGREGVELGAAFMGYRVLPGEPLWRKDLAGICDEALLERLARQLAEFLRALHMIPLTVELQAALPFTDEREAWEALFRRIEARLFDHMRPDARAQVRAHFSTFLADPALGAFEPVVRHGDFGSGNVLWDPAEGIVTGVIDFGAIALGDPATDLASLAAGFGDAFLERCARYYSLTPAMRARMAFYRGTFALQEALFGAENDDAEAFAAGIAAYR